MWNRSTLAGAPVPSCKSAQGMLWASGPSTKGHSDGCPRHTDSVETDQWWQLLYRLWWVCHVRFLTTKPVVKDAVKPLSNHNIKEQLLSHITHPLALLSRWYGVKRNTKPTYSIGITHLLLHSLHAVCQTVLQLCGVEQSLFRGDVDKKQISEIGTKKPSWVC